MIQIVPSQLVFTYNSLTPLKAFISLKNRSSSLIAYKVKSTATTQFDVFPNRGQLKPNQSKSIEFRSLNIISKAPGKQLLSQARFMVQCVPITTAQDAENDQIWRNKIVVQSHKIKIRWDGFQGDFPVAETQIPYNSVKRQVEKFVNPTNYPALSAKPSKKTKSFNKIMVILMLFVMGIVFGYGIRWYRNHRNPIILSTQTIEHHHQHHQKINPIQVIQSEHTDKQIRIRFKINEAAQNKEYKLHINAEGKAIFEQ